MWALLALVLVAALYFLIPGSAMAQDNPPVASGSPQYEFHWASPLSQIDAWISEASYATGINPAWIKAIMYIESRGKPDAQNPSDPSYGLMALMVPTAIQMSGDSSVTAQRLLDDPQFNCNMGAAYLAWLQGLFGSSYSFADWADAYNEGPGNFEKGRRSTYGAEVTEIATGDRVFLGPGDLAEAFAS